MQIPPFKLERYFAKYEFSIQYLLSASDCDGLHMAELLGMASKESLALWNNLKLDYTESAGHPLLRQEIANLYETVSPEDVLIAVPEEAIFITMQTLLRPGDHVVAITPTYQSLYEIACSIGCEVSPWNLELVAAEDGAKWQLNLEKLEQTIRPETRLLIINFPNNPTGYLPDKEEMKGILQIAEKHNLYVFSDEMYRWLELDESLRLPSIVDAYQRGITLSGLSKSFALPGLRLGWLATRVPGLLNRLLEYKDYTTICNSAPAEILGIIALQNKDSILSRNLEIIQQNLRQAREFFGRHSAYFQWIEPNAGSIAFPAWLGTELLETFCQQAIEQLGVMIVPASMFDVSAPHFRVGLGRKNFGEALNRLEKYFEGK